MFNILHIFYLYMHAVMTYSLTNMIVLKCYAFVYFTYSYAELKHTIYKAMTKQQAQII